MVKNSMPDLMSQSNAGILKILYEIFLDYVYKMYI
jgi:hypothetical protein